MVTLLNSSFKKKNHSNCSISYVGQGAHVYYVVGMNCIPKAGTWDSLSDFPSHNKSK